MLNRIDIEYLKRVNGIRKKMGIGLDSEVFNQHSFIAALTELKINALKKRTF